MRIFIIILITAGVLLPIYTMEINTKFNKLVIEEGYRLIELDDLKELLIDKYMKNYILFINTHRFAEDNVIFNSKGELDGITTYDFYTFIKDGYEYKLTNNWQYIFLEKDNFISVVARIDNSLFNRVLDRWPSYGRYSKS